MHADVKLLIFSKGVHVLAVGSLPFALLCSCVII